MTDSYDQPEDLDAAVAGEMERLKRLPPALLHALGSGLTRIKYIGDRRMSSRLGRSRSRVSRIRL
jgi:hypothetical protein